MIKNFKDLNINYIHMPDLGSSQHIRKQLYDTKNFNDFCSKYEDEIKPVIDSRIAEIINLIISRKVVLFCFEKDRDQCHRSVIVSKLTELRFQS
jgi:uncharacterized protein (DUF488 family)